MTRRVLLALVVTLGSGAPALAAQDAGTVETFARMLAAEDARRYDEVLYVAALADGDSSVRAFAATSLGRIGDTRAIPHLARALSDPDSTVQLAAVFALGLVRDAPAAIAMQNRVRDGEPVAGPVALELITAAAKVGGPGGASILSGLLEGSLWRERTDADVLAGRAALESWRLGPLAPIDALLPMVGSAREDARIGAVFSLGRLKSTAAASRFIEALGDRATAQVRAYAARALTRSYADSARLAPKVVMDLLVRATRDEDAGVRISALRSLGSFGELAHGAGGKLVPLLSDPVPNVQVQAVETLGLVGGPESVPELERIAVGTRGSFALRREGLLSLARLDTARYAVAAARWTSGGDWRERAAAARGWARADVGRLPAYLNDPDPRVIAAALGAWGEAGGGDDSAYVAACRRLLGSRDAVVRSLAADGLATAAVPADLPALLTAFRMAERDSFPDAAFSALGAIVSLAGRAPQGPAAVEREALATLQPPTDYLIRRWAEERWPAAAELWGPAYPLTPGRTMDDYREVARLFLIGQAPERYPTVRLDLENNGVVQLELFGPEAPLTVLNFLRLVDRRYFDGQRFHRVVPGFVVQAGDPRGDGWGGPGEVIRDEINRRRYGHYYVGMALSGPDTGGSQWFITLSPQPHLDGGYTVFGRVTDGMAALLRLTEGDPIRSIRR